MNYNFSNSKKELKQEEPIRMTQGAALRGNKLAKAKEKLNPQAEALKKVRERYEK